MMSDTLFIAGSACIHRIRSHHSRAGPLSAPCGHGQDQWMERSQNRQLRYGLRDHSSLGYAFGWESCHRLGFGFLNLETVQSLRADFAGWFLLCFGAIYFAWGIHWAKRAGRTVGRSSVIDNQKNSNFSALRSLCPVCLLYSRSL